MEFFKIFHDDYKYTCFTLQVSVFLVYVRHSAVSGCVKFIVIFS